MRVLKKTTVVFAFFFFAAACASEKALPLPATVYYFPSRSADMPADGSAPDPEQILQAAIKAFGAGNHREALGISRLLAEQFAGTPWYKRSLFLNEQVLIGMDIPAEADAAMLRVQSEYSEMADYAVWILAEYHHARSCFTRSAALYQHLVRHYPESALALPASYRRGKALLAASAYSPAADVFEEFLRNHPSSEFAPDAALALGQALVADARADRAVQEYRTIWIRYPASEAEQGAVRALSELSASGVKVAPWTGDEWYERGMNLFRARQYDKAAYAFKNLLTLEPDSRHRSEALLRIGISGFYCGRRTDAAAALERMVKEHPRDRRVAEALYWAGRSYSRLGEREKGIAALRKVVEAYPKSAWADDALYLIGNIYRDADDTPNAMAFYGRLAARHPDSRFADSAIWWNAWAWYKAGEYRKTEQALQKLADRYPRSFLVHQARYWQGRAAEKMGNNEKAAEYYGKVLKGGAYTYYGYRAAERLGSNPVLSGGGPVAASDVIAVICEEEDCLDETPYPDEADDGPPVWTEETQRLFAAEPAFKKTLELMHLDMKKEAAAELWRLQKRLPRRRGALIGLSKAFFELGDYYRSLILVLRSYERYLNGEAREIPKDLWLLAYPRGYWDSILFYCRKYGQNPYLIAAIIRQESRFHAGALSPAGARGVMQVMPATGQWIAQSIRLRGFDRGQLFESDTAINLGTWYVGHLMKRFKGDILMAAAAYNAGPGAVADWISKGGGLLDRDEFVESIPYSETRGYVKKVLRNYDEYRRIYGEIAEDAMETANRGTGNYASGEQ